MLTRIASIHFASVHGERSQYAGVYDIPAVPLGGDPVIIEIKDMVQGWEGTYESSNVVGKRRLNRSMIWGEVIAEDLIMEWTKNGVGRDENSHPGIWIVRDRILETLPTGQIATDAEGKALFRLPSEEEKMHMWEEDLSHAKAADANYAQYLINYVRGQEKLDRGGKPLVISPVAKAAAEAYAPESAFLRQGHDLVPRICPYCSDRNPATNVKCKNCHEVIDVPRYAALQAEQKKAVREADRALTAA